jgi:hypothetical protein
MRVHPAIASRVVPSARRLLRVAPGPDALAPAFRVPGGSFIQRGLANILPTDSDPQTPAGAARGPCFATKVQVSRLRRGSGHSLKVATRVRIPLGLLAKAQSANIS